MQGLKLNYVSKRGPWNYVRGLRFVLFCCDLVMWPSYFQKCIPSQEWRSCYRDRAMVSPYKFNACWTACGLYYWRLYGGAEWSTIIMSSLHETSLGLIYVWKHKLYVCFLSFLKTAMSHAPKDIRSETERHGPHTVARFLSFCFSELLKFYIVNIIVIAGWWFCDARNQNIYSYDMGL